MKRSWLLMIFVIIVFGLLWMPAFSCQPPPEDETPGENGETGDENGDTPGMPTVEMTLFFRNQFFEPGVSPREEVVVPVKREVPAMLAGAGDAVIMLLEGPTADEQSESGAGKVIREDAVILDLFLEEDLLVVNLSYKDPFHPMLSMHHEELAFVEAVVRTATEFPSVKSVWILRDGKPWQAGYTGCCSPLARSGSEMQFTVYYGVKKAVDAWGEGTLSDPSTDDLLQPAIVSLTSPPGTVEENCPFVYLVQQLTVDPEPGLIAPLPADNAALGFDYDLEQRLLTIHLQGSPTQSHYHARILASALVYTFTEIPVVDQVIVTLNGGVWSDGHVLWEEPMGREQF